MKSSVRTITWTGETLDLLDQRVLPDEERFIVCRDVEAVADAIKSMVVRGAPAIGVTAAYGMVIAAKAGRDAAEAGRLLAATRPTAVNLARAVERMRSAGGDAERQEAEARAIHDEDIASCVAMAEHGLELFPPGARVLTHCNTGALATSGIGTALGLVRMAHAHGRVSRLYADETRPFLQGSRLTAWECKKDGIPCTVLADSAAGTLLREGEVDLVVVGTDRTVANGDVANKIGTYPLAVLAARHSVPFYVAGPTTSVDLSTPDGDAIPIEQRAEEEVTHAGGRRVAPEGVDAYNPAFDVTPHDLVAAIVTERGIARAPYIESLLRLAGGKQ